MNRDPKMNCAPAFTWVMVPIICAPFVHPADLALERVPQMFVLEDGLRWGVKSAEEGGGHTPDFDQFAHALRLSAPLEIWGSSYVMPYS